ncbi:ABC transporter substrate-binding protein [Prauserella muralis]|uniref:Glycine/betaine ABC transporter substrate-binding protein n=1 Tax=Prauserella muralis TaxID=588067 RepID=A0A2V4APF7_9PSEU|nr:ABC transporter substrate-binding protein [Prauserella muralis]PXY22590.1 glycine/betaine ABC transporter substrate-binding protein [Prauserella muralis]TWE28287.1 osmoprotectant transport system substrate-binding protein [Prauserella muralis]
MLRKRLAVLAVAGTAAVTLAACGGGGDPLSGDSGEQPAQDTIAVGSANFSEAVLLGEMYAQALQAEGLKVEKKLNIGSREVYIPAVQDGSIDLVPEYTGNLLLYFDKDATQTESEQVDAALRKALPDDLIALEKSEAVDEDAIVVRKETAQKYDLTTIADLKPVASQLVVGGSPEFRERKAGLQGLEEVYGLKFKEYKTLDTAGPITVEALKSGEVDVSQLFTTQSAITENDFVVLEDPKHIHIAQNIVPLVRESKANDTVKSVLNKISAALTTENVTEMVRRIDVDHENAEAVAKDFLSQQGML